MFLEYEMGDRSRNKSFAMVTEKNSILPFVLCSMGEYNSDNQYYTRRSGLEKCLIMYTMDGEGRIEYEGKTFLLKPGYLIAIDCQKYHYYATEGERWHFRFLHFDGKSSFDYVNKINEERATPVYIGMSFLRYYDEMAAYYGRIGQQEGLDIAVIMHKLMTHLIHLRQKEQFLYHYNSCQKEIEKSIAYIQNYYQQEITVEQLAEQSHLSKYYFIKVFKSYTGQTPYDYLLRFRLQQAQRLLMETEKSVEDIGRETGFGESKNFIACFKKKAGVTPLQFRKKNMII